MEAEKQRLYFERQTSSGEEPEQGSLPSALDPRGAGAFVEVSSSRHEARYIGQAAHSNDVGSIKANEHVPRALRMYYFELEVLNEGRKCCIGIGFAPPSARSNRQPGWEPSSFGYHGDDGKKYHGSGVGEDFGPTFGKGDIIGAGCNLDTGAVFYTKNGRLLGTAHSGAQCPLVPAIGLHSPGEWIRVNFASSSFLFDIQSYEAEHVHALQQAQRSIPLPHSAELRLARSFLKAAGCSDTLKALDTECGWRVDEELTTNESEDKADLALGAQPGSDRHHEYHIPGSLHANKHAHTSAGHHPLDSPSRQREPFAHSVHHELFQHSHTSRSERDGGWVDDRAQAELEVAPPAVPQDRMPFQTAAEAGAGADVTDSVAQHKRSKPKEVSNVRQRSRRGSTKRRKLDASLEQRGIVRRAVLDGRFLDVERAISERFPSKAIDETRLPVAVLRFVEQARDKDLEGAITTAQKELSRFRSSAENEGDRVLEQILSLLVTERPVQSELAALLSRSHRAHLADVINRALLRHPAEDMSYKVSSKRPQQNTSPGGQSSSSAEDSDMPQEREEKNIHNDNRSLMHEAELQSRCEQRNEEDAAGDAAPANEQRGTHLGEHQQEQDIVVPASDDETDWSRYRMLQDEVTAAAAAAAEVARSDDHSGALYGTEYMAFQSRPAEAPSGGNVERAEHETARHESISHEAERRAQSQEGSELEGQEELRSAEREEYEDDDDDDEEEEEEDDEDDDNGDDESDGEQDEEQEISDVDEAMMEEGVDSGLQWVIERSRERSLNQMLAEEERGPPEFDSEAIGKGTTHSSHHPNGVMSALMPSRSEDSPLEIALRHLAAGQRMLRDANGAQGGVFRLKEALFGHEDASDTSAY